MSQRTKQRPRTGPSLPDIKARAAKAAGEGRFQQALELAKQVYAGEKSPENKQLLFEAYLGRARELRSRGQTRDALVALGNTLVLVEGMPAWAEQAAGEFAACGHLEQAFKLVEWLTDSPSRGRILALAADAALEQGPAGRGHLPEDVRPGFDRIVRAFEQFHKGDDEAARITLQEIGLQSPFLEWKLLLRGLQAYCAGDDSRALENWTRLAAERLPNRLAAPLRFHIDGAFRAAQPAATQALLQKQGDRLQGTPLMALLRPLQAALAQEDLRQAFRLAGSLLPHLRAEGGGLEQRLAACFYAAITQGGFEGDLHAYRKLFTPPPDDPEFCRMAALACERCGELQSAHEHWQRYEAWVAAHAAVWGGQVDRVRALIWCRMAENAAEVPDADKLELLPEAIREMAPKPTPLQPPADVCFCRSLELAPDLLSTHEALVDYYREREQHEEAEAAARRLLERFPDHVATLTYLGNRCLDTKQPAEALALFERAYRANPLERGLRSRLGVAHLRLARLHLENKAFALARAEYETGLEYMEGDNRLLPLCQRAICELHAGDTALAESFLAQARALAGHALPVALACVAEAVRSKLAAKLKRRLEQELREALKGEAEPRGAVLALDILATYRVSDISYRGQKSHENQLVAYLERLPKDRIPEALADRACKLLLILGKFKEARRHAQLAGRLFPRNPHFAFLEAESYIAPDPRKAGKYYQVPALLVRARMLAEELPAGEERDRLLQEIEQRQQFLKANRLMNDPFAMLEMLHEARADEHGILFKEDDDDDDGW